MAISCFEISIEVRERFDLNNSRDIDVQLYSIFFSEKSDNIFSHLEVDNIFYQYYQTK